MIYYWVGREDSKIICERLLCYLGRIEIFEVIKCNKNKNLKVGLILMSFLFFGLNKLIIFFILRDMVEI